MSRSTSGGLELAIGFQRDEARQAVDETGPNQLRSVFFEQAGQIFVQLYHGIEAQDRAGELVSA